MPSALVIDNLRAAVTRADWFEAELCPKVRSFAEHYGIAILPTKPYTPRHKGKIERGIGYVKSNALKGRQFASLSDQNAHLLTWEKSVADTRIHGTTRRQVKEVFEQVEKPALLALPPVRFDLFTEALRSVHRDGHVEIKGAYYSVPPEFLGQRVWARWDGARSGCSIRRCVRSLCTRSVRRAGSRRKTPISCRRRSAASSVERPGFSSGSNASGRTPRSGAVNASASRHRRRARVDGAAVAGQSAAATGRGTSLRDCSGAWRVSPALPAAAHRTPKRRAGSTTLRVCSGTSNHPRTGRLRTVRTRRNHPSGGFACRTTFTGLP